MLEVTILILPLPNQIILHMINKASKFLLKSPYSSAENIESRFLTYPAMKKLKYLIKLLKYYRVILFWLVHKQNKGIKMIDAIVKLDQYKGIHAWEMI